MACEDEFNAVEALPKLLKIVEKVVELIVQGNFEDLDEFTHHTQSCKEQLFTWVPQDYVFVMPPPDAFESWQYFPADGPDIVHGQSYPPENNNRRVISFYEQDESWPWNFGPLAK
jgi:hypothetical protein